MVSKGKVIKQTQHHRPMNCLPSLVIGIIVGIIVLISLNEDQANVAALPTVPSTVAEVRVTPTITVTSTEAEILVSPTITVTPELPTPTPTEPPAILGVTPTVLYPNGRRFVLRYDDRVLFLRNTTEERVRVEPFAFERLDTAGNPLNHVEGTRWAQLYPFIDPTACIKMVFWDRTSDFSPPACQVISSEARERSDTPLAFWTPREGSTQFRVLWEGQEIARCEIGASRCEVFLP